MTGIFTARIVALFVGGAVLVGCAHSPDAGQINTPLTKPDGARLSSAEAIDIAKREARRRGIDLHRFKDPKTTYESSPEGSFWWVFFKGRINTVGNVFSLCVDDQTGDIEFHPGY